MATLTLHGSCQCGDVRFTVKSDTPVPYQLCACSICRKVAGYSGSVNLGADNNTLNIVSGKDKIEKYNARKRENGQVETVSSERSFCRICSTMLWLWDKHWPELIHPFASAIDYTTDRDGKEGQLPTPDEMVCIMESSKPAWVRWPEGKKKVFEKYPEQSIADWHKEHYKHKPKAE